MESRPPAARSMAPAQLSQRATLDTDARADRAATATPSSMDLGCENHQKTTAVEFQSSDHFGERQMHQMVDVGVRRWSEMLAAPSSPKRWVPVGSRGVWAGSGGTLDIVKTREAFWCRSRASKIVG